VFKTLGKIAFNVAEYKLRQKLLNKKEGARILSDDEARSLFSPWKKGLLLNGDDMWLSEKESYQNICLMARIGAGKTTGFIMPNILDRAKRNCSIVVNDPKGECYEATAQYLKSKGFNIVIFNPGNINSSNFFNPLEEAKTPIELDQVAEILVSAGSSTRSGDYWENGAVMIITVLLKCLRLGEKEFFNIPNLYYLLQNYGEKGEKLDNWIDENSYDPKHPNSNYIKDEWESITSGNKKTIKSHLATALVALKSLGNMDIKKFLSKQEYEFSRLRREKTAVFLITPPQSQEYYSYIVSLFFRSIFNECMREEHQTGKTLPVYIYFDEFGSTYIPDFASTANTIRGYNVSLLIVLQTIVQLKAKYGHDLGLAIQGGFNTNICLSGSDNETSEFFSKIIGTVIETQISRFEETTTIRNEYNLFDPGAIRRIGGNQALMVSKNRQPYLIKITPCYEHILYRKIIEQKPENFMRKNQYEEIPIISL
jgi:type IV secretion system protein VirD4